MGHKIMFDEPQSNWARIKVIGVGGAGTNAVNYMIDKELQGVDFYVANTDKQSLERSKAPHKIQLGSDLTKGLGAGAKPDLGWTAAQEAHDHIEKIMENTDMVFITAGMGGGTGTGAAPYFAKVARDKGILTVGVVTRPFDFERKVRAKNAEQGIAKLRDNIDTLIIIPNQRLMQFSEKKLTVSEAFDAADKVLLDAVKGISDVIVVPARVNVDFADVNAIMSKMGDALMGTGIGKGEKAAIEAMNNAIHCPLIEHNSVKGAKGVLINYVVGKELLIDEVQEANSLVVNEADSSVEVFWGIAIDDQYGDKVKITVIATGFGKEKIIDFPESDLMDKMMHDPIELSQAKTPTNLHDHHGSGNRRQRAYPQPPIHEQLSFPEEEETSDIINLEQLRIPASAKEKTCLDTPAFIRAKKRMKSKKSLKDKKLGSAGRQKSFRRDLGIIER